MKGQLNLLCGWFWMVNTGFTTLGSWHVPLAVSSLWCSCPLSTSMHIRASVTFFFHLSLAAFVYLLPWHFSKHVRFNYRWEHAKGTSFPQVTNYFCPLVWILNTKLFLRWMEILYWIQVLLFGFGNTYMYWYGRCVVKQPILHASLFLSLGRVKNKLRAYLERCFKVNR